MKRFYLQSNYTIHLIIKSNIDLEKLKSKQTSSF